MNRRNTGRGTIYALSDPLTGAIRYVGKTLVVPRDRLRRHVREALNYQSDTYVARWIRTLGREPTLVILEECSPEVLADAEQRWIAQLRQEGCSLTNLTDGGDGTHGFRLSPSTRAKIGAAHRRKVVSPETRARQSEAAKQRCSTPEGQEHLRRLGAMATGRRDSAEAKANKSRAQREIFARDPTRKEQLALALKMRWERTRGAS